MTERAAFVFIANLGDVEIGDPVVEVMTKLVDEVKASMNEILSTQTGERRIEVGWVGIKEQAHGIRAFIGDRHDTGEVDDLSELDDAQKWQLIAEKWRIFNTLGVNAFDWDYDSHDLMNELYPRPEG